MDNKTPRLLKENEISCRVLKFTEKPNGDMGVTILLYKDARVDMAILDETYGVMNWQRHHHEVGGNLYCTISVWDNDKKVWVAKEDVGTESDTEATKGEASDSFKRSGTNWGVGRELYTSPFIFINLQADEWKKGSNGKPQTSYKFGISVKKIEYNDNREISYLVLTDKKCKVRFSHGGTVVIKDDLADEPSEKPFEPKPVSHNDRIKKLLDHHKITLKDFGLILSELQSKGDVPNEDLDTMDDGDFGKTLALIHTRLLKSGSQTKIA